MTAAALADRPDAAALGPVAALCDALVRFSLGADRAPLLAGDRTGRLAAMLDAAAPLRAPGAGVHDSARAAVDCYRAIVLCGVETRAPLAGDAAAPEGPAAGAAVPSPPAGHDPDAPPLDEELLGAFAVDFRGELVPVRLQALAGQGVPGVRPGDDLAAVAGQPDGDEAAAESTTPPPRAPARRPPGLPDAEPGVRSFLYDEWDYHHQAYLKGWCRLYEQRLEGDDRDFFREVHRRHAVLSHQVRRRFGAVRPESQRRVHGVTDGDELDLDAAIGALIDRRSGHAGGDRVYLRRDRAQREVAAAFLVDMSASTDIAVPDPDAPAGAAPPAADDDPYLHSGPWPGVEIPPVARKRRVIDVAKESLALMCDALATLGDAYAIYGFSGEGRARVEFHVAKDFGDRLSSRTWTALAAIEPRRSTRMGPAIRHASARLRRQPARTRLLVVVSDGYPQDRDYGPDPDDEEYGIQDTARALKEAEREGVQTFCITIDPAGHDYLRRMCSEHRYLVIDDVADLPAELAKVYRALAVARRGISRAAAA